MGRWVDVAACQDGMALGVTTCQPGLVEDGGRKAGVGIKKNWRLKKHQKTMEITIFFKIHYKW